MEKLFAIVILFMVSCVIPKNEKDTWFVTKIDNIEFKAPEKPEIVYVNTDSILSFNGQTNIKVELIFKNFKAELLIYNNESGLIFTPSPCSDFSSGGQILYINDLDVKRDIVKHKNGESSIYLCINECVSLVFNNVKESEMILAEDIYSTIKMENSSQKNKIN